MNEQNPEQEVLEIDRISSTTEITRLYITKHTLRRMLAICFNLDLPEKFDMAPTPSVTHPKLAIHYVRDNEKVESRVKSCITLESLVTKSIGDDNADDVSYEELIGGNS